MGRMSRVASAAMPWRACRGAAVRVTGRGHSRPSADHRVCPGAVSDSRAFQLDARLHAEPVVVKSLRLACLSALMGATNVFKLIVVTTIGRVGFGSGAALAALVGVLIQGSVRGGCFRSRRAFEFWAECKGSHAELPYHHAYDRGVLIRQAAATRSHGCARFPWTCTTHCLPGRLVPRSVWRLEKGMQHQSSR